MHGFSFSYWNDPEEPDSGWRFAIVVETEIAQRQELVWRRSELVGIDPGTLMRKIEMATRSNRLEGFTLFYHPGKGWQMSTRREGEREWSVEVGLPDEQVRPIFDLLEPYGHADGPHRLKLAAPASVVADLPSLVRVATAVRSADADAMAAWIAS